ncbi:MAG: hemerythrin domain-containing protein [Oligoflexia bacterium]|nr:hemerythrin domain-containing protein [Oligoflexia bacterium]
MTQLSATQVLRDNHKTIRGLFRQYEGVRRKTPEMRDGVVRELFMMLDVHFRLEEEFLYPLVAHTGSEPGTALTDDCEREHASIRALIQGLRRRGTRDEFFDTGFTNLVTTCEEHLAREEGELFLLAESELAEALSEDGLAESMENRRKALIAAPEYRDARPEVVQNPHGGEQMRKIPGERKAG